MIEIKKLNESHFLYIKSLIILDEDSKKAFKNYFFDDERFISFGIFSNNSIIEVISCIENQEIPAWTLSRQHSKIDFENDTNLKTIIDYFENKRLYQFFTLLTEQEYNLMCKIVDRYIPYLEHIVPPGAVTGYENIDHDILSYVTSEENLSVHLWVLKNEYRAY